LQPQEIENREGNKMKKYVEPQLEILTTFSDEFCVVVEAISGNEVTDRILFVTEDELD